ncbi:MAG: hypothetical protein RIF33_19920 [Cyclobacteriaceae bacterium]
MFEVFALIVAVLALLSFINHALPQMSSNLEVTSPFEEADIVRID